MYSRRIAVAAVALLIVCTALYLVTRPARPEMLTFSSGDQRSTLTLPDSSIVQLDRGSTLRYPKGFGKSSRELELDGEAFFDVKHDSRHPFIISSKILKTTVLGTSFNMEVRNENTANVVVISGRVQVNTENKSKGSQHPVVVTANKKLVLNTQTNEMQLIDGTADARFYSQRKTGTFSYRGETVAAVLADLERIYNVPVKAGSGIRNCSFYGEFSINDDLLKVLSLLAVSLDANVVEQANGKGYTIEGGSCH
jgi:ferric-dicitrate binding protein FerR (iron transport regulator)